MKKIFISLLFIIGLLLPIKLQAATSDHPSGQWYIKDFNQEIVVNKDSSLSITEKITADCPNCFNKHGIFRILSTKYQKTSTEEVLTPIYLESITDFNDQPLKYQEITSNFDKTITWKIGDANRNVSGLNYYKIVYQVKNAIRFGDPNFDEFYWNLNGNFWDLPIYNFKSDIKFPETITAKNSQIDYYTGAFGSKDKSLANYKWTSNSILEFQSNQILETKTGITVSVTFPKNIISPYILTSEDQNYYQASGTAEGSSIRFYSNSPFLLILPIIVFILSFLIWLRYGRDPKVAKTIVPEFEIPEKLPPMEMGMIMTNGKLNGQHISAGIINLAVNNKIKIEKNTTKGFLFGSSDDYKLRVVSDDNNHLLESEKLLIEKIFSGDKEVKISSLKNEFYKEIPSLETFIKSDLGERKFIDPKNRTVVTLYIVGAVFFGMICGWLMGSFYGFVSLCASWIIIVIFAILMPRRPKHGADLYRRILGFKLYMETAEKYRQRFNEKEGIFEKYLPYAMVFGITKLWINKMKEIYGEDYFNTYHPVWFTGGALAAFDADTFSSAITSMSSNMSSTISSSPSSSGAGGGGFSGGGGGGGGGGGW